jgi:Carboxypeptidase regulatory-like domain
MALRTGFGCAAWFAAAMMVVSQSAAAQGVIDGVVRDKLAGIALPFSGVSIVGGSTERLTNADGGFRLTDLPPGVVRLRVRHVGFSPLDTQVVVRDGDTTRLSVRLVRIPVTLAAVRVTDDACVKPGPPSANEPGLLAVFEQLQLNAEQFRLVTTQYPFATLVERRYSRLAVEPTRGPQLTPGSNGLDTLEIVSRTDSVIVQSNRHPRYKPGEIIVLERMTPVGAQYGMTIPNLAVFADPEFVKYHCFRDGGDVDFAGQTYRRVDFRAAADLHEPDVDGSMYLDPETFAIRRSEVSLSRRSSYTSSYDAVIVETTFDELVPGVPVITATNGRSVFTADAGRPNRLHPLPRDGRFLSELEGQVAREIRFEREAPGASDSSAHGKRVPSVISLDGPAGHRRVLGVFDAESGAPIAGAVVRDSASGRSASTTSPGTVGLGFVPRTAAVVNVEHTGYERQSVPVSLTLTDTVPVTIILHRTRAPR